MLLNREGPASPADLAAGRPEPTFGRERMKIAFVVHDYHRAGGHSRYVAELATRFCREHEVHVFANRIIEDGASGIHFHKVPAWRANALTTVLSFAAPVSFQVGGDFDVVHSQGFCGLVGNVFTAHICNRAWHLALEKLAGGATLREFIFNQIGSSLEYCLYRFARNSEMIAVSARVKQDIIRHYHCTAPVEVIYHGTDADLFSPQVRERWRGPAREQYGIPADEFVFLYVGQLRKGARLCIQALAQLQGGMLLCVSPSDPTPYREFAKECGQANRVVFAPHTQQVEQVYGAGDALLLPTPYDSFAMVVAEAMACGLPVVVSREAGVSELVQHGHNGLLLNDINSSQELAGHMRMIQDDRRLAGEMGQAGRKTVEKLTWDLVAEQTLGVYENLVRRRRRS
jgi:glycosyltransferase involved in cell wall biosynthesis